ncbi:MAG: hypothetical protein AAB495_04355 [Patescibacteria group bacterium]
MEKSLLEKIIAELITLGEDAEELSVWKELWDALGEESQAALLKNLGEEAGKLRSAESHAR